LIALAEWLQTTRLSVTIQSVDWIIPVLQSIHIVMIGVVFVSLLVVTLRILGRVRTDDTFAEVWGRFAPWLWAGLVTMAVTGLLLIIGEPVRQATALSFWLKMMLLTIGIVSVLLFSRSLQSVAPASREFSSGTKAWALATLLVWVAIVFLGRAIAYDAAVWGSLSFAA
jgi:uncharacterized membrane protein SirB2